MSPGMCVEAAFFRMRATVAPLGAMHGRMALPASFLAANTFGSAGQRRNTDTPISVCPDTGLERHIRRSNIQMPKAALPYAVPFHSEAARNVSGNRIEKNIPAPTRP